MSVSLYSKQGGKKRFLAGPLQTDVTTLHIGCREQLHPAGFPFEVPAYTVGSGRMQLFLDGVLCVCGTDAANTQYEEVGDKGATSTTVRWHDELAPSCALTVVLS